MKYRIGILLILFFYTTTKSQVAFGWKNYTDMKAINEIAVSANGIWAATGGGGFFYNAAADSFRTLHKADGLSNQSLSAVTIDNYGKIWFGSTEGKIDVYNPSDNSISSILDIYNSDKNPKQIYDLQTSGDTIIVSSSFGISLIDSKKLTIYDTFFRFGNFPSNIRVNYSIKLNLIYAATLNGVAIQKADAKYLNSSESWNVYTTSDGLPSNIINKIFPFGGYIIAATSNGLSQFNGTGWQPFIPQLTRNINDIAISNDSLFILSNNQIYVYSSGNLASIYSSPNQISLLRYSKSFGLVAAGNAGIIFQSKFSSNTFAAPNGPKTNQFVSMAVDNNGVLWSASGNDPTGVGYYKYDGINWTNYDDSNTSSLTSNFIFYAFASPDNTVYLGSWNKGFFKVKDNIISHYDTARTGMIGIPKAPEYLVISGFAIDQKNNLWVLNYWPLNIKPLNLITSDSTWYNYYVPSMGDQSLEGNYNLVIDQYGTKWFSSKDTKKPGLYYYNENNTYSNLADDKYGYISSNDGINTTSISSLIVDARGDLWIGTSLGVNILSNTGSIIFDKDPQLTISSVFTLREQTINCIAVDPLNQKWVGTNQGLLLVNSDGTSLLAAYNAENSPLLNDEIRSIAIDKNSGTVYVGTDGGLTSFKTSAVQPQDSFTKLNIYPSPFLLKKGNNNLTIDGLIKNSSIKILSISGRLIKEFDSPGGRIAYWDGTDSNGKLVSSGVYLVVAYNQDGSSVFTGKVAVINK